MKRKILAKTLSFFTAVALVIGIAPSNLFAFGAPAISTGSPIQSIDANHLTWEKPSDSNPLGGASNFNGMIFGTTTGLADAEGPVATTGNISGCQSIALETGFLFGSHTTYWIPADKIDTGISKKLNIGLMIGGTATTGTPVGNGDVVIGNNANYTGGSKIKKTAVDSYLNNAKADLIAMSAQLFAYPANGTIDNTASDKIVFTGTNAGTNVFTIDYSVTQFAYKAVEFNIPEGSTVLFNVVGSGEVTINSGTNASFFNPFANTPTVNGKSSTAEFAGRILYNFDSRITKVISRSGINYLLGSILAPNATVQGNSGSSSINGTLVAKNLTGTGGFELHSFPFRGGFTNNNISYTVKYIGYVENANRQLVETELSSTVVKSGITVNAPALTNTQGYILSWPQSSVTVTNSDITVRATAVKKTFEVTFVDFSGNTIGNIQTVPYLESATAPTPPTAPGKTFTGWDTAAWQSVVANTTVNPTSEATTVTVNFYITNTETGSTDICRIKTTTYNGTVTPPTFTMPVGYEWVAGTQWNVPANITEDISLIASIKLIDNEVKFVDFNGNQIGTTQSIKYGKDATPPTSPTRTGYTFTGWDSTYTNITAPKTITATYSLNQYTVKFLDFDGAQIGTTQTVNYGTPATAPAIPVETVDDDYRVFKAWSIADFSSVKDNLEIQALYTQYYLVKFVDHNGTVIKAQNVVKGENATAPANPTREGYTFSAWDGTYTNIQSPTTITADYAINKYTVNFVVKDIDKNTISSFATLTDVAHFTLGSALAIPTYTLPTGYEIANTWNTPATITGDTTVTLEIQKKSFAVIFVDFDGTPIGTTQSIKYGEDATAPASPTRDGYTFTGWNGTYTNITAPTTITATYGINEYTVNFVVKDLEDGSIKTIKTLENVEHFTTGIVPPLYTLPTGYEVANSWNTPTTITGNTTITLEIQKKTFKVSFTVYNEEDDTTETLAFVSYVKYGTHQSTLATPTYTAPEGYKTKYSWSDNLPLTITEDTVGLIHILKKSYEIIYNVVDLDSSYPSGIVYSSHGNVVKHFTLGADLAFPTYLPEGYEVVENWDYPEMITGPRTITLTIQKKSFTVNFFDFDGTPIGNPQSIKYGDSATAPTPPTAPDKTFTGWDTNAWQSVSEATNVYPSSTPKIFTVTFEVDNNEIGLTQTLSEKPTTIYNGTVSAPSFPMPNGYEWNTNWAIPTNITSDITLTASIKLKEFTVKFFDFDGNQIGTTQTIKYGYPATAEANPVETEDDDFRVFTAWSMADFSSVQGNLEIRPLSTQYYLVNFVDHDGTVLKAENVVIGESATAPTDPTREGYHFTGWNGTYTAITAPTTITATYGINKYTVSFVVKDLEDGSIKTIKTLENVEHFTTGMTAPEDYTLPTGYEIVENWDYPEMIAESTTITLTIQKQSFAVKFFDFYGNQIGEPQTVKYGDSAEEPTQPNEDLRKFTGWSTDDWANVTKNLDVTALFEQYYTVTFYTDDGVKVIGTSNVIKGGNAIPPVNPTKTGHTFTGWDTPYTNVQGELVVKAKFTRNIVEIPTTDIPTTQIPTAKEPAKVTTIEDAVIPTANPKTGEETASSSILAVLIGGIIPLAWVWRKKSKLVKNED